MSMNMYGKLFQKWKFVYAKNVMYKFIDWNFQIKLKWEKIQAFAKLQQF